MPNRDQFHSVRKEYSVNTLSDNNLPIEPFSLFKSWYQDALDNTIVEPNAFALATCIDNKPSVRFVLLKGFETSGFIFYSNYESRKGQELDDNPFCSGTFYWKELERQVRFEGTVSKLSEAQNSEYFSTRPRVAQIGVHVSKQSKVIASREILEAEFKEVDKHFADQPIPCPSYWGGYVVEPKVIEFWQGRVGRLHDRIRYKIKAKVWEIERLSP